MATTEERERLVGKAVIDRNFRQLLFSEPEAAAASLDITLTEGEIDRIRAVGPDGAEQLAGCLSLAMPSGGGGATNTVTNYWQGD